MSNNEENVTKSEINDSLKEKVNQMKGKLGNLKDKIDEKQAEEKDLASKGIEPLVTCRVLFISVLDKIILIILALMLIILTYTNFNGSISSIDYNYFDRIGNEILILILMVILYLIYNWIYKCYAKTILCLTKNEVYKEAYLPFFRWEHSIPLNKITQVNTFKFLWIFRAIVIHQYGRLPIIFWTWNNDEFKLKTTELITGDKEKVQNKYETKNLINNYKIVLYIGVALVGIILLIGIVRFFAYNFSDAKSVAGTYRNDGDKIVLKSDGTCDITDIEEDSSECKWSYNEDNKEVVVKYKYRKYTETLRFNYDKKEKTLEKGKDVYKK